MTTLEALGSWGSFDLDNPFPLFAEVRELGAVHPATLADGHDAWLVVRYEEAMAALNDSRLSKDMHAALATGSGVVAEGLPGPEFARHMLTVDPPDHTRLRRLVSAAFSPRRVESLRPHVQTIADDLLDAIAAHGPDRRVDLVADYAFPLPFTVICELLGVPHDDRAPLGREFTKLLVPTSTAAEYAAAKQASDAVVGMLKELGRGQAGRSRRRSGQRVDQRPRRRRAARQPGVALDDLPADRRRPRHHRQPHRQQRRRPLPRPGPALGAPARPRARSPWPSRSCSASTRPSPTRRSATRSSR